VNTASKKTREGARPALVTNVRMPNVGWPVKMVSKRTPMVVKCANVYLQTQLAHLLCAQCSASTDSSKTLRVATRVIATNALL